MASGRYLGRLRLLICRMCKSPASRAAEASVDERLLYRKNTATSAPPPQNSPDQVGVAASRVTGGRAAAAPIATVGCAVSRGSTVRTAAVRCNQFIRRTTAALALGDFGNRAVRLNYRITASCPCWWNDEAFPATTSIRASPLCGHKGLKSSPPVAAARPAVRRPHEPCRHRSGAARAGRRDAVFRAPPRRLAARRRAAHRELSATTERDRIVAG